MLMGRTLEQALDAYTQATHGALRKLGKKPVVWEGATFAWRCRSCTRLAIGLDGGACKLFRCSPPRHNRAVLKRPVPPWQDLDSFHDPKTPVIG
jgi:hypothetical protein